MRTRERLWDGPVIVIFKRRKAGAGVTLNVFHIVHGRTDMSQGFDERVNPTPCALSIFYNNVREI